MRRRALIFDDQAPMRQILWTVFDRRGYEVFTYPDPSVCPLSSISECPCPEGTICADVIVSDIQMLRVNGIDFVQQLLEKRCKLPHIAVISGSWTDEDRTRAEKLGCKIFEKPFGIPKLIHWLNEIEHAVPAGRSLLNLVAAAALQPSPVDDLVDHFRRRLDEQFEGNLPRSRRVS